MNAISKLFALHQSESSVSDEEIRAKAKEFCIEFNYRDDDEDITRAVVQSAKWMRSLMSEKKWVSVSERLPEYYKEVLAMQDNSFYIVHRVSDGEGSYYVIGKTNNLLEKITHWMPLPNPPQE